MTEDHPNWGEPPLGRTNRYWRSDGNVAILWVWRRRGKGLRVVPAINLNSMDETTRSGLMSKTGPSDSGQPAVAKESRASAARGLSDPERWVEEHGDYLFKYALVRMRDTAKAEDMVQETFLAALRGGKSFAGKSAEKTWLVGIMKNKIGDYYRKAGRETSFSDLQFHDSEESDQFVSDGLLKGGWVQGLGPLEWQNP